MVVKIEQTHFPTLPVKQDAMFYASLEKTQDELILLTEEIYNGYLEYDE
jgi:hypothetical protein